MASNRFFIKVASNNGVFFSNAMRWDAVIYPESNTQKVLIGNNANVTAALTISSNITLLATNNVYFSNIYVGIGASNPTYPFQVQTTSNSISIYAAGDIAAFSDARYKCNIQTIPNALNKVNTISGYTFERMDATGQPHGKRLAGVLAQEMQEVLPEVVNADADGNLSVAYGNISALLIQAIKELKAEVQDLKLQIHDLVTRA